MTEQLTFENTFRECGTVDGDKGLGHVGDVGHAHQEIDPVRVGVDAELAAQAIAYGKDITWSGPAYKSVTFAKGKATLTFTQIDNGLVAKDGELTGFTIAGEDKKFVPATAKIVKDKIEVSSKDVAKPIAVRYAWSDNPVCNVFSKDGLPLTPFRTDDFPMLTAPKP